MGDRAVDSEGYVYERGWDGEFHDKQGFFGPERETDFFGNPKVERDFFGNPKQETDWLGNQVSSDSGEPLYDGGSSSSSGRSGGNDLATEIGGWIVFGIIMLLFSAGSQLFRWGRANPEQARSLLKGGAIVGGLLMLVVAVASAVGGLQHQARRASASNMGASSPATRVAGEGTMSSATVADRAAEDKSLAGQLRYVVNTDGQGVRVRACPGFGIVGLPGI